MISMGMVGKRMNYSKGALPTMRTAKGAWGLGEGGTGHVPLSHLHPRPPSCEAEFHHIPLSVEVRTEPKENRPAASSRVRRGHLAHGTQPLGPYPSSPARHSSHAPPLGTAQSRPRRQPGRHLGGYAAVGNPRLCRSFYQEDGGCTTNVMRSHAKGRSILCIFSRYTIGLAIPWRM